MPALIETLEDQDEWVRRYAAEALETIGLRAEKAIPALTQVLNKHKDPYLKLRVVRALGAIGLKTGETVPTLINAFKDSSDTVRSNAAKTLARMELKALPALIEGLRDKDTMVRRYAAWTMKEMAWGNAIYIRDEIGVFDEEATLEEKKHAKSVLKKIAKAVPDLVNALKDNDAEVRQNAVWALEELEAKAVKAIPPLSRLAANDPDFKIRKAAKQALKKIHEGK